jgi:hypothetical protein
MSRATAPRKTHGNTESKYDQNNILTGIAGKLCSPPVCNKRIHALSGEPSNRGEAKDRGQRAAAIQPARI